MNRIGRHCFNCGEAFAPGAYVGVLFGPGTETCKACLDESYDRSVPIGQCGAERRAKNASMLAELAAEDAGEE